jgi:hypothetical protein
MTSVTAGNGRKVFRFKTHYLRNVHASVTLQEAFRIERSPTDVIEACFASFRLMSKFEP